MTRRALAHSLADEIRRRPQATPYRHTFRDHLRDVLEILAGFAVLALIGAALWLWLAIAAISGPAQ